MRWHFVAPSVYLRFLLNWSNHNFWSLDQNYGQRLCNKHHFTAQHRTVVLTFHMIICTNSWSKPCGFKNWFIICMLIEVNKIYSAKIKIFFVSPYPTDPLKLALPKICFHNVRIKNIYFVNTILYFVVWRFLKNIFWFFISFDSKLAFYCKTF